jgi:hypothetical protein
MSSLIQNPDGVDRHQPAVLLRYSIVLPIAIGMFKGSIVQLTTRAAIHSPFTIGLQYLRPRIVPLGTSKLRHRNDSKSVLIS